MRRRILSRFSWYLVLIAGLFQIFGFVLEQGAIQLEEKLRNYDYEIIQINQESQTLSTTHKRFLFFHETFDDMSHIIARYNFNSDEKVLLINALIIDAGKYLEDVSSDNTIKKYLKDEKFLDLSSKHEPGLSEKCSDTSDLSFKDLMSCIEQDIRPILPAIDLIIRGTQEWKENTKIDPSHYSRKTRSDYLSAISHVFNYTKFALYSANQKARTKISTAIDKSTKTGLLKQQLLLYSVSVQLLSLLALLLLFRDIILKIKGK